MDPGAARLRRLSRMTVWFRAKSACSHGKARRFPQREDAGPFAGPCMRAARTIRWAETPEFRPPRDRTAGTSAACSRSAVGTAPSPAPSQQPDYDALVPGRVSTCAANGAHRGPGERRGRARHDKTAVL